MGSEYIKRHQKAYRLSNSAVRKWIAGFFYSTPYHINPSKATKYEKAITDLDAANLPKLRLFFVIKSHYIAFYRSRAPPPNLEVH